MIAAGSKLASCVDAEGARAALDRLVCEWCIASLGAAEGHRISGRGYGSPLKVEVEGNRGSVSDHVCKPADSGSDTGRYVCACAPGWGGSECQDDVDECVSRPCMNGGRCFESSSDSSGHETTVEIGKFRCECELEQYGDCCEDTHQQCQSAPCQNGGQCHPVTTQATRTYSCQCATGWSGANCEDDVDECHMKPCENGGTCMESGGLAMVDSTISLPAGEFLCTCKPGFGGEACGTDSAGYKSRPAVRAELAAPSACGACHRPVASTC